MFYEKFINARKTTFCKFGNKKIPITKYNLLMFPLFQWRWIKCPQCVLVLLIPIQKCLESLYQNIILRTFFLSKFKLYKVSTYLHSKIMPHLLG